MILGPNVAGGPDAAKYETMTWESWKPGPTAHVPAIATVDVEDTMRYPAVTFA